MESMVSFMAIDRLERSWAVCEVEKVPMDAVRSANSIDVDCFMTDVDLEMFVNRCLPVFPGNVYSVVHVDGKVIEILKLEDGERQRRLNILRKMGF